MTPAHAGDYLDANNTTVYAGAFMTPFAVAARRLCLVALSFYSQLANIAYPLSLVAAGNSALTLVRVSGKLAAGANTPSIALYAGVPEADFTGTLTATFAANQRGLAIAVDAIDAALAEPVRLANIPTPTLGTGTGVTSTLAALAAATSLHYYAVAHQVDEGTTLAGGFTRLTPTGLHFTDAGNSTGLALETAWKLNDTTADPSWATSSAYAVASLEIQPAAIAEPTPQTPYMPLWLAAFTPRLVSV